ncbi:MAG: hypothetical protein U1C57_02325 [Candidatus Doudnabacteria bacterium]|nr:hypothetical protein [bacterium]MDZ4243917.1 hypothetical protein [Candidatus Doudnabacteria bacterium]
MATTVRVVPRASMLAMFGEKYSFWELQDMLLKLWAFFLRRNPKDVTLDDPPSFFTPKNLERARRYNILPVFFPKLSIHWEQRLGPKQKPWIKLGDEFYLMVEENPGQRYEWMSLQQGWNLVDLTPVSSFGTEDDPLWPLIASIRKEHEIGRYSDTPAGSRYDISAEEWRQKVCPLVERTILRMQPAGLCRLEPATVYNVMCNAFDADRQRFRIGEWLNETVPLTKHTRLNLVVGDILDKESFRSVSLQESRDAFSSVAARPIICFPSVC